MDLREQVEAQHAVGIAHTLALSALIAVMRSKGLLTQADVNTVFDSAISGAEDAPEISADVARRARRILELISGELQGPPRDRV